MAFFKNTNNDKIKEGEKLFRMGLMYSQNGNQEMAIDYFNKSIDVNPIYPSAYLNRGGCLMIQERFLAASEDFERVLSISGDASDKHYQGALNNLNRLEPILEFERSNGDEVRSNLIKDGIDHLSTRFAQVIYDLFLDKNRDMAKQFLFEELNELSEMGGLHQEFALNCGVGYARFSEVSSTYDTTNTFIFFRGILCCFSRDKIKMFEVRKHILKKFITNFC